MTQKMKPSVIACNKRRKRNEVQDYNRKKILELRRVVYIAPPIPQRMEPAKHCAPSVVTILALIHLAEIGI